MRRHGVLALLVAGLFLAGLAFLFSADPALAEGSGVTVSNIRVSNDEPFQGQSVQITFDWTNPLELNRTVVVQISAPGGETHTSGQVTLAAGASGKETVSLTVGDCAAAGTYMVEILGAEVSGPLPTLNVGAVSVEVRQIGVNPVSVKPGGEVTIKFDYRSNAATEVEVAVGSIVSRKVSLSQKDSWSGKEVKLTIPENVGEGKYAVTVKRCGGTLDSLSNAVEVKKEPTLTAAIITPTQSEPASVKPGSSVRVYYRYTASESLDVDFKILKADGGTVTTAKVSLAKAASATNKYVNITVPSGTAPGRYDLVITDRPAGKELSRAKEAVRALENANVSITAPRKAAPALVNPGAKVTVSFEYTANPKTEADVVIAKADGAAMVSAKVTLDKTVSKKKASVTLTVPSSAAAGKYDVVVKGRVSGGTLAEEKDLVLVEPKIEAAITAPTRAKPELLNPGENCRCALITPPLRPRTWI